MSVVFGTSRRRRRIFLDSERGCAEFRLQRIRVCRRNQRHCAKGYAGSATSRERTSLSSIDSCRITLIDSVALRPN